MTSLSYSWSLAMNSFSVELTMACQPPPTIMEQIAEGAGFSALRHATKTLEKPPIYGCRYPDPKSPINPLASGELTPWPVCPELRPRPE